jgi:outer membrane protein assembly factor BamB
MTIGRLHISVFAASLSASVVLAAPSDQNWPAWRGPLHNGVSPNGDPPIEWSETKNVKWKVKVPGRGTSTPIVWENQIFLHSAIPTGKKIEPPAAKPETGGPAAGALAQAPDGGADRPQRRQRGPGGGGGMRSQQPTEVMKFDVISFDRKTGSVLWQKTLREELPHEGHQPDNSFASYSPVTDGQHIISYFGSRGLHCLDLKGNIKWQKDLGKMQTKNSFGEGSSPALYQNTVVVLWDHEGADFIAAFDKNSGKELWREQRDEDTTWSTPLIVPVNGKPQVVVSATRKIRSYDLATGKQIWECAGMTANAIPSPVMADGVLYATSGFRGSALFAIKLAGASGDIADSPSILWKHSKSTPYVPSPLLYEDKLYFFAGNNAMLSCFDAKTGKPLIDAERIDDLQGVYASPTGASGRVYLVGRNGAAKVIKNSGKVEVLASNKLDDRLDASPAIAGKELFLRGHEHLYCLAEK